MTPATNQMAAGPEIDKRAGVTTGPEVYVRMYRQMVAIRLFEERANDLYTRALMPGLAHLYIGEEAVAVGVCEALRPDDYITSTHRGHGHCLAKGAAPHLMFAELLGKEAGYCKGKGGSMHIADPATGNLGANAIVGGGAGIATGAAFASKYLRQRARRRLLLRRRRPRSGRAVRGNESRPTLDAAGDLRLREQHVQRIHPLFRDDSGRDAGAAGGIRSGSCGGGWTGRSCGAGCSIGDGRARAARRGSGVPAVQHLPLPRSPRRRHRTRLLPVETGRAAVDGRAGSHHASRAVAGGRGPGGRGGARRRAA